MLWTRFAPDGRIGWEVSGDETFTQIAARGEALASARNDYCVKVDARGLSPGRRYFYRFLSAAGPSPTGRTLTAPSAGAERLNVALFSCANLAWGYFHAYGDAAAHEDIDLVLHVGDYIYELERGAYPSEADAIAGRVIEPPRETIGLSDYSQRYASYHADPDLLELRRLKPICAVWDDHEIADNAWRGGALNHQSNEGVFADRAAAAAKAYFDWLPIRESSRRGPRLYRALDWGDLARIVLLDTRLAGRDRQLEIRELARRLSVDGADRPALVSEFRRGLDDPRRSMLGAEQERWLSQTFAASKQRGQTWQIAAQQVVVGDQVAPPELTRMLRADVSPSTRSYISGGVSMSALGLPTNLDAWAGYPAARARLLEACATHANNAIVLGGDTHNCWANNLTAPGGGRLAALEFAGGSVSSPGLERHLTLAAPGERESVMQAANPQLAWCDVSHRGYGALTFTRNACAVEWRSVGDNRSPIKAPLAVTSLRAEARSAGGPRPWMLA